MPTQRPLTLAGACLLGFLNSFCVAQSLPPLPPASPLLDVWRFDDAPLWWSAHGYAPLAFTNIQSAPSFEGNSVQIDTNDVTGALLKYAILQDDGNFSLGIPSGTIFLWAQPNWSSSSTNGTGPEHWASLLSIGSYLEGASASSNFWLSLVISPTGDTLYLLSATSDSAATAHLTVPISWKAGDWHSVVAGFDETSSFLALDGVWTNGPGIALGDAIISNAFYVGSTEGFWQFHGQINLLCAIGSFEVFVTVDQIDVGRKHAVLKVWMFNLMDARSFGRFTDYAALSGMANQWMWWDWTEDYSW